MGDRVDQDVFKREEKYCMAYGFKDISKVESNRDESVVEYR